MKKNYIILLILFLSVHAAAQIPKSQIQARINFSISPGFEFTKVASDYNLMSSLSANLTFNNKVYLGGYISKKTLPILHTDFIVGQTVDVSVQHFGINIGASIVNIKSKNSYVIRKSKIRLTYGVRIGGGALWLNDVDWNKVSSRDYFYLIQPSFGLFRPLGTFVTFTTGVYFQATYGVGKVGPFLSDKDFMTPGVFIALHITTFK